MFATSECGTCIDTQTMNTLHPKPDPVVDLVRQCSRPVTIGNASTVCVHRQESVMASTDQAKSMARQLRAALSSDGMDISHSRSLELVAKALGHADWNSACAKLDQRRASPGEVRFNRCSPILRIFDEMKAREFYCGFLGFQVAFEHRFSEGMPLYLGLERSDLSLHLSEHHGDASPGGKCFCDNHQHP